MIFTGDAVYSKDENLIIKALTEVLNIKIIEQLREEMSGIYTGGMGGGISKRPNNEYNITVRFPCGPENVDKLTKALFALIKDAQEKGIEQKDLDKVKETMKKHYQDQLKQNDYWLEGLSSAWINGEDAAWIVDYSKRVDAISVQQLQDAAKKYFNFSNYIKAVLNPEK